MGQSGRAKILICDDSFDLRIFLNLKLSKAGYDVLQAEDGKECIEILKNNDDIDVLILDIMMPNMNGIQTLHQLKLRLKKIKNKQEKANEKDTGPSLKVIFCSAKGEEGQIEAALQGGGDDYIVKPVDPKILIQKIERLLGHNQSQRFAIVPSNLDIKVKEYPSEEFFKLIKLSEIGAHLELSFKVPDGEVITVLSETLDRDYNLDFKLKGTVVFSEQKVKDIFETEIVFKGLNEFQREKIRSVTVKTRELKDPSDEEEEEDSAT